MKDAAIAHAFDLADLGLHVAGQPFQFRQFAAEYLDRVLAFDAGDGLFDIVLDILREIEVDADEFAVEPFAQFLDQRFLGHALRPLIERLQRHEEFGEECAVRIEPLLAPPLLGNHGAHRRIAR